MTAIAAVAKDGEVWIGGDSAVSSSGRVWIREDEKVFKLGPLLIGSAGSIRDKQAIRYHLELAPRPKDMNPQEYMVCHVVEEIRKILRAAGCLSVECNVESMRCSLVIGYEGQLFEIEKDFQVGRPSGGCIASGCGEDFALGSLCSTKDWWDQEARIRLALEVAAHLSDGVRPPFTIKRLKEDGTA